MRDSQCITMCGGRLAKDFYKLQKEIASFSDKQARVLDFTDDLTEFTVEIIPNGGLYERGKFVFRISVDKYPDKAPSVMCETMIFHPNIDMSEDSDRGEICLNLFDEWAPGNDLEDCVQGLLFLLYNPNLEDPLTPWFNPQDDYDEFVENVLKSLQGEEIDGVKFERNVVEDCENDSETAQVSLTNSINPEKFTDRTVTEQTHDIHHPIKMAEKIRNQANDGTEIHVPLVFLETPDGQCIPLQL